MSYASMAMVGLNLIGNATIESATFTITGLYDKELSVTCFNILRKELPTSDEDLDYPDVKAAVERIKDQFRREIQGLFDLADKQEAAEAKEAKDKIMKDLHSPSTFGTVAEISAKYGVSKSDVRKHKAAGTLEQLINMNQV